MTVQDGFSGCDSVSTYLEREPLGNINMSPPHDGLLYFPCLLYGPTEHSFRDKTQVVRTPKLPSQGPFADTIISCFPIWPGILFFHHRPHFVLFYFYFSLFFFPSRVALGTFPCHPAPTKAGMRDFPPKPNSLGVKLALF